MANTICSHAGRIYWAFAFWDENSRWRGRGACALRFYYKSKGRVELITPRGLYMVGNRRLELRTSGM